MYLSTKFKEETSSCILYSVSYGHFVLWCDSLFLHAMCTVLGDMFTTAWQEIQQFTLPVNIRQQGTNQWHQGKWL